MGSFVPVDQVSEDDYDRVLGINTKGVFLLSKAVIKVMKTQEPLKVQTSRHGARDIGRGAIVNIASVLSTFALPGRLSYVASKHAVVGLGRSLGAYIPVT